MRPRETIIESAAPKKGVKHVQHEVWGDLLFLINFSMDFLCLYLTARLLHRRLRPLPAIGAAVLGGVYSVAALFIEASRPISLLLDAAVCALMCAVAFARRGRRWRQLLSEIGVYFAVATALGGMMTALFNLLNRLHLPKNTGGDSISAWLFLLLALISGLTAWRGTGLLRGLRSRSFAEVEIAFCGRRLTLHGVTDSGNLLRDPITGRAVIITDTHSTLPLLPPGVREAVVSGRLEQLEHIPESYAGRIRLIPGKTVAGSRLLVALLPDSITLHTSRGAVEVAAVFAPAELPALPDGCSAVIPGELI